MRNRLVWDPDDVDIDDLRQEYEAGKLRGMGELATQYRGYAPNDPAMDPLFALAFEFDVPVLIHAEGIAGGSPAFRIADGHPELLQEVLIEHPQLRLYMENAGFPFLEEAISLMYRYPNVYADLSTITWIIPREVFYNYFEGLMDAGLGKRLMFGSDQMYWPESIDLAIDAIELSPFLSKEQKRDIFYNNAARFLRDHGVIDADFNSYGSRRGNHEIMMRGTFGNIRIRNEMTPQLEGGYTHLSGETEPMFIYDAAMAYQARDISTVVVAGKEYGTGSSRDWAAKGALLLGVRAVIVESFERIHRANLVGMGVLPLQFMPGDDRKTLGLSGDEHFDILGLDGEMQPKQIMSALIRYPSGERREIQLQSRIDTAVEVEYYRAGGVLTYVMNRILANG